VFTIFLSYKFVNIDNTVRIYHSHVHQCFHACHRTCKSNRSKHRAVLAWLSDEHFQFSTEKFQLYIYPTNCTHNYSIFCTLRLIQLCPEHASNHKDENHQEDKGFFVLGKEGLLPCSGGRGNESVSGSSSAGMHVGSFSTRGTAMMWIVVTWWISANSSIRITNTHTPLLSYLCHTSLQM